MRILFKSKFTFEGCFNVYSELGLKFVLLSIKIMKSILIVLFIISPVYMFSQTLKQIQEAKKQEQEAKISHILVPPIVVRAAFAKDFPSYKVIKWEKEKGHFEANNIKDGVKMSYTYNDNGQKIESETIIPEKEMPQIIKDYVAKHYKGYKINEYSIIKKANGQEMYEVEVTGLDLHFTKEGKFINAIKE